MVNGVHINTRDHTLWTCKRFSYQCGLMGQGVAIIAASRIGAGHSAHVCGIATYKIDPVE
jgi:hypothetical protein